jgi:hypothetical protein
MRRDGRHRFAYQLALTRVRRTTALLDVRSSRVRPNPASLEELYVAARQHDFAVTLSNGGTAYVFVLPSASEATSTANASAVSGHLLVRDNTVTAYVHSPPASSAPPAQQKASLPLIAAPGRDGALIARCT